MSESNAHDGRHPSDRLDAQLAALASTECRYVLYYFQRGADDAASISELAEFVAENVGAESRERVATRLHHRTLPRLVDAGALDYEAREGRVRYRGGPGLEELAALASAMEWESA